MKESLFVNSEKEVCGCIKVGSKNINIEWWNEEVMRREKVKKRKEMED